MMFRCVNKKGYLPPGDDTFGEHDDDSLELGVDHWEKLPFFPRVEVEGFKLICPAILF